MNTTIKRIIITREGRSLNLSIWDLENSLKKEYAVNMPMSKEVIYDLNCIFANSMSVNTRNVFPSLLSIKANNEDAILNAILETGILDISIRKEIEFAILERKLPIEMGSIKPASYSYLNDILGTVSVILKLASFAVYINNENLRSGEDDKILIRFIKKAMARYGSSCTEILRDCISRNDILTAFAKDRHYRDTYVYPRLLNVLTEHHIRHDFAPLRYLRATLSSSTPIGYQRFDILEDTIAPNITISPEMEDLFTVDKGCDVGVFEVIQPNNGTIDVEVVTLNSDGEVVMSNMLLKPEQYKFRVQRKELLIFTLIDTTKFGESGETMSLIFKKMHISQHWSDGHIIITLGQ